MVAALWVGVGVYALVALVWAVIWLLAWSDYRSVRRNFPHLWASESERRTRGMHHASLMFRGSLAWPVLVAGMFAKVLREMREDGNQL